MAREAAASVPLMLCNRTPRVSAEGLGSRLSVRCEARAGGLQTDRQLDQGGLNSADATAYWYSGIRSKRCIPARMPIGAIHRSYIWVLRTQPRLYTVVDYNTRARHRRHGCASARPLQILNAIARGRWGRSLTRF